MKASLRKFFVFLLCAVLCVAGAGAAVTAAELPAAENEELEMEELSLTADQLNNYNGMTIVRTDEGLSLTGANKEVASSQFKATMGNSYCRLEATLKILHPENVRMARFVFPVNPAIWIQFLNTDAAKGVSLHANGEYRTATVEVEEFFNGGEITLVLDTQKNLFSVNGQEISLNPSDFDIPNFADINIQFTTGNDPDAGVLLTSVRVATAPEEGNDISTWPYFDPETGEEQDDKWIESGATLVNVKDGVAVMTSDAGYKNVLRYNDGYQTKRGYVDISNFSVTLNAVTKNTITTVDFWLMTGSRTLCIRIENMGSGSSYNAYVFDYTQSQPPCLGLIHGIPANKEDRGTYVISYDYAGSKTIRVNGTAIPITEDPAVLTDYPEGYRSVRFSENAAQIAFGVQSDTKQHKDEMVVLSKINNVPVCDFYPTLSVDLTKPWTVESGLAAETTDAGLKISVTESGAHRLGYGADLGTLDKHDLKSFSMKGSATSISGYVLTLALSGKSASTGGAISALLELTGAGTGSVSAILKDGTGAILSAETQISAANGLEISFSVEEQTFTVNGTTLTRTDSNASALDFAFSNATLLLTLDGAAGDTLTLSELCDTPIAYYEPSPNYEREVPPGHKVSDDFKYDPWNAGNLATPSLTEEGVSVKFTGTWSGSWYDVPMSYTTRYGEPNSSRKFLSAYITAGDANSGDNGIGVAFTLTDYDGPPIDESGSLRRTTSLVVKISLDGTKVSCMDENWANLGGGTIMGSFTDPAKNGFLIEFDTETCTLYVNGVKITGNFDKFSFKNNATYFGVFGSSAGTDAAVVNALLLNGEPLVEGAEITLVEFPDVDEIRVEEQLENTQITADENRDFNDPDLKYSETYLDTENRGLDTVWIVLIAVGGALILCGGAAGGIVLARRRKK